MDPVTVVGVGGITAYLTKDAMSKLLGPTADYLGEGLRDFTQHRIDKMSKIFENASKKLGDQLEKPGNVPPKILKTIINDATYSNDPLVLEYFGGILASARTEDGRDDRGARLMKIVDNLSTYQLRTHYLIYSTVASLFSNSDRSFATDQFRRNLQIFLPFEGYVESMEFSKKEWDNPQTLKHIWHGLSTDGLIEDEWGFGPQQDVKTMYTNAPTDGIVCQPTAMGAELFLWAFGYRDLPFESMFHEEINTSVSNMPCIVPGAVATRN